MSILKEVCGKLISILKSADGSTKDKLTHRTRNDFVVAVYDALFDNSSELELPALIELQDASRAYSFYELADDEPLQEAYNNGFVYGLTRLCEIAAEKRACEANAESIYLNLSEDSQVILKRILEFVGQCNTAPKYEDVSKKIGRTKSRISQIMAFPGIQIFFDIKHFGREKRLTLSPKGKALLAMLEESDNPADDLNADKLSSVIHVFPKDFGRIISVNDYENDAVLNMLSSSSKWIQYPNANKSLAVGQ